MADRDEGFEEYEPLPYNAKKWILPGTILFFLVNLIIGEQHAQHYIGASKLFAVKKIVTNTIAEDYYFNFS